MAFPSLVQSATVSVLGRNIRYVTGGGGTDAFVFVHGFGADHTIWMNTLPSFAGRGRIYALDLPAHGGSDIDVGAADISFFAELLTRYLDAIGVERVHFIGHSLGGAIATEVAARSPERVTALTLIAPACFGSQINRDFVEGFIALSDRATARNVLAMLVRNPNIIGSQMVDRVLTHLARPGVRDAMRSIVRTIFPADERGVRRVWPGASKTPIRVVWGAEDKIIPLSTDTEAQVRPEIIERTGHLPHMEAAAKVNRLIRT